MGAVSPIHKEPAVDTRRIWTWMALGLYVAMLAWAAVPGQQQALFGGLRDKLLHLCAYGLIAAGLHRGESGSRARRALRTIAAVAVLGAVDEALQLLQAHRTADVADWLVDVAAALSVAALAAARRERPQTNSPGTGRGW